jgi:hypothetical protein
VTVSGTEITTTGATLTTVEMVEVAPVESVVVTVMVSAGSQRVVAVSDGWTGMDGISVLGTETTVWTVVG